MRICYFGTYRAEYVRNRLMIDRLKRQGFQVMECHVELWQGSQDRHQIAAGGWVRPSFWWRLFIAYVRLLWYYKSIGAYDVLMVGYPGHLDVLLARLLAWMRGKPLVWDILMSIYLISVERGLEKRHPVAIHILRSLERITCRLPDLLLVDTQVFADWYQENYAIQPSKIRLLPLGADDRIFLPLKAKDKSDATFTCLYYGSFIPNHGVQYILDAAQILSDDITIQFELIGQGPELNQIKARTEREGLVNVIFIDWMEPGELVQCAAQADVCLGTFGKTPQALMTMHNKIFEGMAMARPVINGDSPVMRATLIHGKHIYLCERENGASLARAICTLKDNPDIRLTLVREGHQFYKENFALDQIGSLLCRYLLELNKTSGSSHQSV